MSKIVLATLEVNVNEKAYSRTAERGIYYMRNKERENANSRKYYWSHREQILARHKEWGRQNPDKVRARNRLYLRKLAGIERGHLNKIDVLINYSNPIGVPICNNCGEMDTDVLCIDHINGGGNNHFRELRDLGIQFHPWLIKNNYPDGFQVLCANCNMRKAKLEYNISR